MVRKFVLQQYIPTVPNNNKNVVKESISSKVNKTSHDVVNSSLSRVQENQIQVMKTMISNSFLKFLNIINPFNKENF